MSSYAVLSFTDPSENMKRFIEKASLVLGSKLTVATTPDSEMNKLFYKSSNGERWMYSEKRTPFEGLPIYINPKQGNLRPIAIRK